MVNNEDRLQTPGKNQNLPSVEEIPVLYSHFQSCVPSACPELHCKRKLLFLHIHAYACITPFLNFHIFLFRLVLNFCFILKSSWWSRLLKSQNFCESSRKSEFCMLCISFLLWLSVLYIYLVGHFLFVCFFFRKKACFKLSKFMLGSEVEGNKTK